MKESIIEARLRKAVERAGGRCLKFVSPGHTGVPDRIILMPGGRVFFAETKAPGKTERARQEYVQRRLREMGFEVFSSVDNEEKIAEVTAALELDRETRQQGGLFECFHCGARAVGWEADFEYDDMGYEGEGLVQFCSCQNCGAQIEYDIPNETEEKQE